MPIKLLLVDDSSLMRLILSDILRTESEVEVVDTATNGKEAAEKACALKPDVILLDMLMKDYDGLFAIKAIMRQCPTPILILSNLGNTEPDAIMEALQAGAIDYLNKPEGVTGGKVREIARQLVSKIKAVAATNLDRLLQRQKEGENVNMHVFSSKLPYDALVIGASTGGTGVIENIIKKLPANLPMPVVVAQHMNERFLPAFAARLNKFNPMQVKLAEPGEKLLNNAIYVLPGTCNLGVERRSAGIKRFMVVKETFSDFNNPSINCLMNTMATAYKGRLIGVLLTGMGRDGALGLKAIKDTGGMTLVQDEDTSVVFGMPRVALEIGAAEIALPDKEIAGYLIGALDD